MRADRESRAPDTGLPMDAEQIVRMTPESVRELIDARAIKTHPRTAPGKRVQERWPFAGTVEVWLPSESYGERHLLATMHNLSVSGLAMRTRRPIASETRIELAIHEPELSCYGKAIVRHCTPAPAGYLVGVEFDFDSPPES